MEITMNEVDQIQKNVFDNFECSHLNFSHLHYMFEDTLGTYCVVSGYTILLAHTKLYPDT